MIITKFNIKNFIWLISSLQAAFTPDNGHQLLVSRSCSSAHPHKHHHQSEKIAQALITRLPNPKYFSGESCESCERREGAHHTTQAVKSRKQQGNFSNRPRAFLLVHQIQERQLRPLRDKQAHLNPGPPWWTVTWWGCESSWNLNLQEPCSAAWELDCWKIPLGRVPKKSATGQI